MTDSIGFSIHDMAQLRLRLGFDGFTWTFLASLLAMQGAWKDSGDAPVTHPKPLEAERRLDRLDVISE